jgi:hypothetical protein
MRYLSDILAKSFAAFSLRITSSRLFFTCSMLLEVRK